MSVLLRCRRRKPTRAPSDRGFGLIEVVVAIAVFTTFALAAASMSIQALHTTTSNRQRVEAANIAAQNIEQTRAQFRATPAAVTSATTHSGVYAVQRVATWFDLTGSTTSSTGQVYTFSNGGRMLRVEVTVTWPNMHGVKPVIDRTVLS